MRTTTNITSLVVFLWATIAKASAATEEGFLTRHFGEGDFPLLEFEFELLPTSEKEEIATASTMLRGKDYNFPPIPPIHPVHTGSAQYSSGMDSDGTITYRRDINAPCDYGILIFNIGPSADDLPYHWDVYADAYIWSDNGGLCILNPTYTGFQVSHDGPFWRPGYDPTTVKFKDLVNRFTHMHRISSRMLGPEDGAPNHTNEINHKKGGDYVMMTKGDFYNVDYYQRLKAFVNSWGPNGYEPNVDENNEDEEEFVVWDHTSMTEMQ